MCLGETKGAGMVGVGGFGKHGVGDEEWVDAWGID